MRAVVPAGCAQPKCCRQLVADYVLMRVHVAIISLEGLSSEQCHPLRHNLAVFQEEFGSEKEFLLQELLVEGLLTKAADVFALGILIW